MLHPLRHTVATLAAVVRRHSAASPAPYPVEEATIAGVPAAYLRGEFTTHPIVAAYLERIAAYNQRGLRIHSIINLNGSALAEADALDGNARPTANSSARSTACLRREGGHRRPRPADELRFS